MHNHEEIDQYDLVEIIQVPEKYVGVINIGDVGVVVEKYDDENFQVECVQPGGSYKWLEMLNISYIRLRSKDPYDPWIKKSLTDQPLMQKSIFLGMVIGATFGALIGAGFGAITMTLNGILVGFVIGLVLGVVTGALTAALTVKTAGTTGGIGVGYFTGMVFGAVLGMILGLLIPTALWMRVHTAALPVLDGLMISRFETVIHISFLFSVLATVVGVWVAGKNLLPTRLTANLHERIDQYDLVEIVYVPEMHRGVIDVGDIGIVVEIYDDDFEIECVRPDGSYKWLKTLNSRYVTLKHKIPDNM